MIQVAALYVEERGCYSGLPHVDPWPISRDARLYDGPWPVVAHPPCARWCNLAGLVEHRYPHLKKGEDGGCFAAALASVRRWGGVLEHPAHTRAWNAYGLPLPSKHGWQRGVCGGWVTQVEQAHYGHRGRKATWLYAFGTELPALRWGKADAPQLWLSWCGNRYGHRGGIVQRMNKRERAATPIEFRDLLIAMAVSAGRRGTAIPRAGQEHRGEDDRHAHQDGDVTWKYRDPICAEICRP